MLTAKKIGTKKKQEMSSKDFSLSRRIGVEDVAMVASVGFKKQLWSLDKELDVIWDFVAQRWEIWRFPGQKEVKKKVWNEKAHHVLTLKGKDGGFRELGSDVLLQLQAGDTSKYSLKQLIGYFDQLDRNVRMEKERALLNKVEGMNRDMLSYVFGYKAQVPRCYKIEVPAETRTKRIIGG